jgi:hypothetical protein
MKEIVEGLRGPALGVVVLIFILAGTIVIAAFAALIAQMSLFMRMHFRDVSQTQTSSTSATKATQRRFSASPSSLDRQGYWQTKQRSSMQLDDAKCNKDLRNR